MITSQVGSSSRSEQHCYPPSLDPTHITHTQQTDKFDAALEPNTISYLVHTETNGISDLRLQVSQEASSSKEPLRPIYFRERFLSEHNEIVDNILDANTARICWSIHRPTRGWYLYLRSPVLPQGTAISIRGGETYKDDPTASPLTFSVNTKVRMQPLSRVRSRINHEPKDLPLETRQPAHYETSVDHSGPERALQVGQYSQESTKEDVVLAVTGRENRKTMSGGHARRRSGATGSGSHIPDLRHPSKRPSSAVMNAPMIPEVEDEDATAPILSTDASLSRLAIPATTNTASSAASSPLSAGGDRPYSPTQPSSSTFPANPLLPRTSTFVVTESKAPTKQSWARWACSILPSEIRPNLSLDGDKSFSLFWTDAPGEIGNGWVEVVKFEDQSGRWMWNSHTRGRLTLQTSAAQAVGLEQEFWVAVALAYVQFLEEKDAYDAARDA
ncbi:uncharacterized protein MEPE_00099 [Melanopsichium pennsylvanicum]|uniref:Uncharacterized protein n=2 Tax=Melanopsichium pennsylvanicum TaxID=63383 RepID=A0AAJ4XFF7_9BASI|nr:putative protein [Melanopsichium pennsylvanicum 4]SNX81394.1 uncharacterized protein MEPE_00099 [Melanopsichium pennsylvanicum]